MCGIGGILNLENQNINLTEGADTLSKKLRHRGPDDEGFLFFKDDKTICGYGEDTQPQSIDTPLLFSATKHITQVEQNYTGVFIHRRLSIIDLSESGHQPMCTANGKIWITYNGEIYNYLELRQELAQVGFTFITQSDTEVLLNAYLYWGNECLQKLNGMFAFALYDIEKKKLFCARDRSGVKPLYYYFKDGIFCFASEIKALRALPFVETALNERALQHYLLHDALEYEPEGFLKNIFELFPAHYLELDLSTKQINLKKYFDIIIETDFIPYDEARFLMNEKETHQVVTDAIIKRLRADVPVGCCLSGGIDSSIISGVIAQSFPLRGDKRGVFNAFTATFPNETIDESKYAKEVAHFTDASWQTVTPTAEELQNDFKELIYALDIPIWSTSTYAQFRVMQLAKQNNIKVVLDGQGSDELFAGYPHYYTTYVNELLRNKQFKQAATEIKDIGNAFWYAYTKENAKRQLHYNSNKKQLNPDFVKQHTPPQNLKYSFSSLNEHLQYDFFGGRLKTYLRCEDRCSMHHSVESRTPFADDTPLIDIAFKTPATFKIKNGTSKYILRESMKNHLPFSVYSRKDKMGFVTPHNKWLQYLVENNPDLLNSNRLKPFFSHRFLNKPTQASKAVSNKEDTLTFKALVFTVWADLMKI
ncbi:MAG: asparagine synthase (glutamine-hydrolyzing) [Bacteroidia bacterium]